MMLDDLTTDTLDKTVHSVAHGVIRLEELAPAYGPERRRLRVLKYRGQKFRGGYHDFIIDTGGVRVFPRLVSSEHKGDFKREVVKSRSPELDALLGGGISRAPSSSGRREPARRCSPSRSPWRRSSAARKPPCSFSTRSSAS
jgi:circadian clock protein KaiC